MKMTYLLHNGSTSYIIWQVERQTEKEGSLTKRILKVKLYRPETEWANNDQIEIWEKKMEDRIRNRSKDL